MILSVRLCSLCELIFGFFYSVMIIITNDKLEFCEFSLLEYCLSGLWLGFCEVGCFGFGQLRFIDN